MLSCSDEITVSVTASSDQQRGARPRAPSGYRGTAAVLCGRRTRVLIGAGTSRPFFFSLWLQTLDFISTSGRITLSAEMTY